MEDLGGADGRIVTMGNKKDVNCMVMGLTLSVSSV